MKKNILELASSIYDDLSKRKEEEYELKEFSLTEKELDAFFQAQKALLLEFIEYKLNGNDEFPLSKCKKFYQEVSIPYIVIDHYIKRLKITLMKQILKRDVEKTAVLHIEAIFDEMLNVIAQVYFKKELHNKEHHIKSSKFDKFPLYAVHLKWSISILEALSKEELDMFPHESAQECAFAKMMQQPASLMVCMDATLCKQLDLLHQILHNNVEALYRVVIAKEYTQALFIFREFSENLQKFFSLLKDLYHLTYTDLEKSFFKLIEMLEYSDKEITLSMIDIQNLKQLNVKYGETTVDKILKSAEDFLTKRVQEDPEESLLIRAISANFYICSLNKDPIVFQRDAKVLLSDLQNHIKDIYPNYDIFFNFASLQLDKKMKYQKNELVRLLLHIKAESKRNNGFAFVYISEEQKALHEWLKEHYYNIRYVEEKLNLKMVDVMLQPIYKNGGKEIYAYEALARFKDGSRLIPAGAFIDTVYQIDRVSDLDRLVLEAILEKKEWILSTKKKLFINTSPLSLLNEEYIKELKNFIGIYGHENLLIEITEQQAVESFDAIEKIHKEHNIKFAIDDFGSGYSSLKTVSDMIAKGLVDVLKIDGSLVMNLDKEEESQKIVQIITQMCKVFNITSLAEFIENEETMEYLADFGTELLQGYYLSKPLHIEEVKILR